MSVLLSVVIPTHNRSQYAFYAIRSILSIQRYDFEIVVSDTSSDDKLSLLLATSGLISDVRLRYVRPIEPLDMTGNHNFGIDKATGQFVCLIGDDDTITQDAFIAAQWALDNKVDIIAPNIVANYAWPDFRSLYFGDKHSKRLYLPKRIGYVKTVSSNDALSSSLQNAAQGTDNLPKIYHGIVRRTILDQIKEISGTYFHGSSPDVSGAIALALCSKDFIVVDYPLTIPGASGGSNTGRSALNRHKGKLNQEAQTKAFENNGWSIGVPKFFSVETVWAHAAIETINKIAPDKVRMFNFCRLLAICKALHPEFSEEINQAIKEAAGILNVPLYSLNRKIRINILEFKFQRIFYVCKRLLNPTASGGRLFIPDLETIETTPAALSEHMKKFGWSWVATLNAR